MNTQKKLDNAIVLMIVGFSLMTAGFLCSQIEPFRDVDYYTQRSEAYPSNIASYEGEQAYKEHLQCVAFVRGFGQISVMFGILLFAAATIYFARRMKLKETFTVSDNEWDIEITLTEGPINGYFFNIPTKYQHLIQEGDIDIINDIGETMHCNTVTSMGKGRITKNLNNWYKMKKFQPGDKFYLKKLDDKKFRVVSIKRVNPG